jgi:putative endonuclease
MPREWLVYLLRCRDGSLYTGITNVLARRLVSHRAGKGSAYVRARLPVCVVYREPQPDRSAALRRELAIKKLTRRDKLALIRSGR